MRSNLTRKILQEHVIRGDMAPGEEIDIRIDQVLMQDHTGTQALLHFEALGLARVCCRLAVCYADHGVLQVSSENMQDHIFLQSASRKYGIWFAKPGSGICHQIHMERFAVPGATLLGADSHTPHCGGVGMIAVGAGGMDAAAALASGTYSLRMPKVLNVRLEGELRPWCSAKDVALELLRRLSVKGGLGSLLEFTGSGVASLNVQQRSTITNMCTELGATGGIFPSDGTTLHFFRWIGREDAWSQLEPDLDAEYDGVIEMDLSGIEPLVALPGQPDKVVPVSEVAGTTIQQVMIGGCTNGSYTDLLAVADIVRGQRVHPEVNCFLHPSSRSALELLGKQGMFCDIISAGIEVASPTCGACIGIGHVPAPGTRSLRTINRNFKGRSGLKDDAVYLCSAETAAAAAIMGVITDPRDLGPHLGISAPNPELRDGISPCDPGIVSPAPESQAADLKILRGSNISPAPVGHPLEEQVTGEVLLKVGDDVSTDEIMPASSDALAFRSNIPRISDYLFSRVDSEFSRRAREKGGGWIVAGLNYGQGSSREHAAIAPAFVGVKGVVAKSFSRIHHANLVNFGLLPLVFDCDDDYSNLEVGDVLTIGNARAGLGAGELVLVNETKRHDCRVRLGLTDRSKEILRAGGMLPYLRSVVGAKKQA